MSSRQHKKELQELRKKKVQKKVARLQEIEEAREKEKQRWKEFAHKSGKKGAPIAGKQKRSIFAVPDSIHGKVCDRYLLFSLIPDKRWVLIRERFTVLIVVCL